MSISDNNFYINIEKLNLKTVKLTPGQVFMKEKTELTMYTIHKWDILDTDNGIKMTIVFTRKTDS